MCAQMNSCETAAMREGVNGSKCIIAVITGGEKKADRYFERPACVAELKWAIAAKKVVVPVIVGVEKPLISTYIAEGKAKGIDLADCQFVDFNNSHPSMTEGSMAFLNEVMKKQLTRGTAIRQCTPDPAGEFREKVNKPPPVATAVAAPTNMQMVPSNQPVVVTTQEKYCGPISLIIGCCIFPCIICCPIDVKEVQKVVHPNQ